MKKLSVLLSLVLVLFLASSSQAKIEWDFEIQPILIVPVGLEKHIGDLFYWTKKYDGDYCYGITYDPIFLNLGSDFTVRQRITIGSEKLKIGISGWKITPRYWIEGRITSPQWQETSSGYTYYENGVRMWDYTILPVVNELEPSGLSPVDWKAGNIFDLSTIDFFAQKISNGGLNLLGIKINPALGLKIANFKKEQHLIQKQRAFIYDAFGSGYHWDNKILLWSVSSAECDFLKGPLAGLEIESKSKRFSLKANLNQSLLFGKVNYSSLWQDTDDIWIAYTDENGSIKPLCHWLTLEGKFPISKTRSISLPVTEISLQANYELVKEIISIGIGGFASIWQNVPEVPKFSVLGDWTAFEGTGWKFSEKTLKFFGLMVNLSIHF